MSQAFIRLIVQVQMGDFDVARGQRIRVDAESMILRRDFHLLGQQVLHRMIRAMMAESQLESLSTKRKTAQLMAQTDSKNRDASQHCADTFDRVCGGLGIARSV